MWPKSSTEFHPALSQTTILHPPTDSGAQQQSPGKGNMPEVGSCETCKVGKPLFVWRLIVRKQGSGCKKKTKYPEWEPVTIQIGKGALLLVFRNVRANVRTCSGWKGQEIREQIPLWAVRSVWLGEEGRCTRQIIVGRKITVGVYKWPVVRLYAWLLSALFFQLLGVVCWQGKVFLRGLPLTTYRALTNHRLT